MSLSLVAAAIKQATPVELYSYPMRHPTIKRAPLDMVDVWRFSRGFKQVCTVGILRAQIEVVAKLARAAQ